MSLICPLGAIDSGLAEQLDITWGNPDTWTAQGLHWTHLPEIRAAINRKVSGDIGVSPLDWFFRTVATEQSLPLNRVLVLGCGSGALEREIYLAGWAREIVAIDLSAKVLEVAQRRAQADGVSCIQYFQSDMNHLPVGRPPFTPAVRPTMMQFIALQPQAISTNNCGHRRYAEDAAHADVEAEGEREVRCVAVGDPGVQRVRPPPGRLSLPGRGSA